MNFKHKTAENEKGLIFFCIARQKAIILRPTTKKFVSGPIAHSVRATDSSKRQFFDMITNGICVVCSQTLNGQKQKYCSNACKQKDHYHRVKQQTNTYHSQTIRSLSRKIRLIEMFGGKCAVCGYNKNLAALHFHHKNSKNKQFKLDMRVLSNKKWEYIVEEAQKCELLCSNCHSENHNPELSLKNVQRIVSGAAGK